MLRLISKHKKVKNPVIGLTAASARANVIQEKISIKAFKAWVSHYGIDVLSNWDGHTLLWLVHRGLGINERNREDRNNDTKWLKRIAKFLEQQKFSDPHLSPAVRTVFGLSPMDTFKVKHYQALVRAALCLKICPQDLEATLLLPAMRRYWLSQKEHYPSYGKSKDVLSLPVSALDFYLYVYRDTGRCHVAPIPAIHTHPHFAKMPFVKEFKANMGCDQPISCWNRVVEVCMRLFPVNFSSKPLAGVECTSTEDASLLGRMIALPGMARTLRWTGWNWPWHVALCTKQPEFLAAFTKEWCKRLGRHPEESGIRTIVSPDRQKPMMTVSPDVLWGPLAHYRILHDAHIILWRGGPEAYEAIRLPLAEALRKKFVPADSNKTVEVVPTVGWAEGYYSTPLDVRKIILSYFGPEDLLAMSMVDNHHHKLIKSLGAEWWNVKSDISDFLWRLAHWKRDLRQMNAGLPVEPYAFFVEFVKKTLPANIVSKIL